MPAFMLVSLNLGYILASQQLWGAPLQMGGQGSVGAMTLDWASLTERQSWVLNQVLWLCVLYSFHSITFTLHKNLDLGKNDGRPDKQYL